mmetsp:Transcript_22397/g.33527  ORF Transcript_22397/g.33527 Transcript_22397/m.33527 type:complete len:310 (+) Transcript_22397:190-1119(+)|eukprot:CAMPEP_0206487926 /NCGR_PEP_ID=MMETSP0324_2-20121206/42015_1 /ASSEMBLY_ACC=CAM_ASM_000836 /TAXON_ID=2866 /ORGANISM="Crypthecodinium cohnii, Strain Seligo" /LENGTH=309 /DNA_ID=CAMNT_0053966667 /DNA_START=129 /DNA_END=1058 /DNA_ORIENTATION=-
MSHSGTIKNYNPHKGFGFITDPEGKDFFVHVSDCGGAAPVAGDVVTFDLEPDRDGQPKATNVVGCTGDATESLAIAKGAKGKGKGKGPGSQQGVVRSYNPGKGWGFIDMKGTDVFLHIRDCLDGVPRTGDWVSFDSEDSGRGNGELKASNVSGCTGWPEEKGKGKGGDWGKAGGYGPMWGPPGKGPAWGGKADAWGGKGGPYGGGKGMEAWGGKGWDAWGKDGWGGSWAGAKGFDPWAGKGDWGKGYAWGMGGGDWGKGGEWGGDWGKDGWGKGKAGGDWGSKGGKPKGAGGPSSGGKGKGGAEWEGQW